MHYLTAHALEDTKDKRSTLMDFSVIHLLNLFIIINSSLVVVPKQLLLLVLDAITKHAKSKNKMWIFGTCRESDKISVFWEKQEENEGKIFG